MMLKLFDKNATSFSSIGLGVLKDFASEPIIEENLNGNYFIEFDYALNGYLSDKLIQENIIVYKNQIFSIESITKEEYISVYAKHIFLSTCNSLNFLEDVYPKEKNCQQAIQWLFSNAKETVPFSVSGNCTKVSSARYVNKNLVNAIYDEDNCILNKFGGELSFDGLNVYANLKRGKDTGIQIREGKNISGKTLEIDFSTVRTKIKPKGKDGLTITEQYIESPLINNYKVPFYECIEFNNIGIDDDTTEEQAQNMLKSEVQSLFDNGLDKPQISLEIDFVELSKTEEYKKYQSLETCSLGDTVSIYIPSFNLNAKSRIIKTLYNVSKERIVGLEIGTPKVDFATSQANTDKIINRYVNENSNNIQEQINSSLRNPLRGYKHEDPLTGNIYLSDNKDLLLSSNIWCFNMSGLAFSSSGINGTFEIGITSAGYINGKFIQANTIEVDRITGLQSKLDEMKSSIEINSSNVNFNFSQITGNNYYRNSYFFEKENNKLTFWKGVQPEIVSYYESKSKNAAKLGNGKLSQTVILDNGIYAHSIKYKKLLATASATISYNNKLYNLDDEGTIESIENVTTNSFTIEINCDTDGGFLIYEPMLNKGDKHGDFSQNACEIINNDVNIGKGIQVSNDNLNSFTRLDADGLRGFNKDTNKILLKQTVDGLYTNKLECESGEIGDLLINSRNYHTFLSGR